MSIINSIVVGKAKGKVGNVVLVNLKGQQVMKSLNTSPANPKTPLQVASRSKMSNAVLAWQFLAVYLQYMSPLRKSTESTYNAFVRLSKSSFDAEVASSPSKAAQMLNDLNIGAGNFISATTATYLSGSIACLMNTGGLPFMVGTICRLISYDVYSGENFILEKNVTEAEWLASVCTIVTAKENLGYSSTYFYNVSERKCSNISFIVA